MTTTTLHSTSLINALPVRYASKEVKFGSTVTVITQKAYGEQRGLKGQELKRAHSEYRRSFGLSMNQSIAGAIAGGAVVAQKVTPTKNGYTVAFVRPEILEVAVKVDKKADALKSENESLKAKLAAMQAELDAAAELMNS